jgi:hypothetical protein
LRNTAERDHRSLIANHPPPTIHHPSSTIEQGPASINYQALSFDNRPRIAYHPTPTIKHRRRSSTMDPLPSIKKHRSPATTNNQASIVDHRPSIPCHQSRSIDHQAPVTDQQSASRPSSQVQEMRDALSTNPHQAQGR